LFKDVAKTASIFHGIKYSHIFVCSGTSYCRQVPLSTRALRRTSGLKRWCMMNHCSQRTKSARSRCR